MDSSGEAAEQVVRMSLEGVEVAARITGEGAKNIAVLLYSILKEEKKTKGKARLTSMLRSGKELKVFTVRQKDLAKFTKEAKKYGVLYCVLTDRQNKDPNAEVDVIARAEDASKISRIVERFNLASVDTASIVAEAEANRDVPAAPEAKEKSDTEKLIDDLFGNPQEKPTKKQEQKRGADFFMKKRRKPHQSEKKRGADFFMKKRRKPRRSKPSSERQGLFDEEVFNRPSVKKELKDIQKRRRKEARRNGQRGRQQSNRRRADSPVPVPQKKPKTKIKGAR